MSVYILFEYIKECKKKNIEPSQKGLYDYKKLREIKYAINVENYTL
ncbi:hypothetical protein CLTEP_25060 [Clostridium tepidiprofundi DSM 19306]|uniref:Uncharacterized protein n=1 Tax=Clostridium tepidiprofundi DSM 19306 TaxID=1121338 RepID=A0A151AT36_9CLOT|nr:hypothetical protein [Clostridium tepidiprofundi]KYH30740.1 hypothetical protein CLTEP_25060 [Clostridium tepidiprofundi DSM 19306]